jgi:hypothetical protein
MEERVLFINGGQRKFIKTVKEKLEVSSIRGLLQFGFEVPYSTLKNYYNEINLLPKSFFLDLCHISKLDPRKLNIKYLKNNWGQVIGGKRGMATLQKKYSEEIKKWQKLGSLNSPRIGSSNCKKVNLPLLDEKLAEFIGAYLGDGTITPYQIKIAGDTRYDSYYYLYLSNLVFDLFGISPKIHNIKGRNTSELVICSKKICSFLNKNFGIKYGAKIRNQTKIPFQILNNKKFTLSCLRGLIDTDGSISRRGRKGSQFCIQFTNHNKTLLNQVIKIGRELGIFTFSSQTGTGTNKWVNIERYFRIVGSSNLKHIIRFHLRKFENKTIYRKDLLSYFKQDLYNGLDLPFKLSGSVV